jgi:hypothetical protein
MCGGDTHRGPLRRCAIATDTRSCLQGHRRRRGCPTPPFSVGLHQGPSFAPVLPTVGPCGHCPRPDTNTRAIACNYKPQPGVAWHVVRNSNVVTANPVVRSQRSAAAWLCCPD